MWFKVQCVNVHKCDQNVCLFSCWDSDTCSAAAECGDVNVCLCFLCRSWPPTPSLSSLEPQGPTSVRELWVRTSNTSFTYSSSCWTSSQPVTATTSCLYHKTRTTLRSRSPEVLVQFSSRCLKCRFSLRFGLVWFWTCKWFTNSFYTWRLKSRPCLSSSRWLLAASRHRLSDPEPRRSDPSRPTWTELQERRVRRDLPLPGTNTVIVNSHCSFLLCTNWSTSQFWYLCL